MKRVSVIGISLLLLCSILFNFVGCAMPVQAEDLMHGITSNSVDLLDDISSGNIAVTDFALRMFNASKKDGNNILLSPLSVLCALAMVSNGADNETKAQIEKAVGMSVEDTNLYLYTYVNSLTESEKNKLSVANSIWFTDNQRFTVNPEFLQINADYYSADIYKTAFDSQTVRDINNWIRKETDHMIPKVIDDIPDGAIMYIINALAFEAEWSKIYEDYQVRDGVFTKEDGTRRDVEFMYSGEGRYIADDNATGFIKYYKGLDYAFVALLPDEGVSVNDYISSLDGERLNYLISNAENISVKTSIPKFETDYEAELSDVLNKMGITDAFDSSDADFSALGSSSEGNIFISSVIHKTYIQVAERGTKAGAVTVMEMNDGASAPPEKPKEVYLDRPFVYMLIDCENKIPFFIGSMMDTEK